MQAMEGGRTMGPSSEDQTQPLSEEQIEELKRYYGFDKPVLVSYFQWLGKVGFKGVFDGRHSFRLNPTEHGTRFEHSEQFTGILAGPVIKKIGDSTEAGFTAMNEALKARVEAI